MSEPGGQHGSDAGGEHAPPPRPAPHQPFRPAPGGESVWDEPQFREDMRTHARCWKCGYPRSGLGESPCPECGAAVYAGEGERGTPIPLPNAPTTSGDGSVWDEPSLSPELAGSTPTDAETYRAWYDRMQLRTGPGKSLLYALAVAMLSGPMGVLTAFWEAHWDILAMVLWGPAAEEVGKTALIAFLVERFPYLFRSWARVVWIGAVSGLAFAVIENLIYFNVYIPHADATVHVWRWTVCTALHTCCTSIACTGLARAWRIGSERHKRPNLSDGFAMMVLAICVHGLYNLSMVLLEKRIFGY
ncbi:MAG: PrsW family glutamic-type intramembrane protease [Phycisphaerales bacterium]